MQMRKYRAISLNSIENILNSKVQEELILFRSSCEIFLAGEHKNKQRRLLPKSNCFIKVGNQGRKTVAIVDPETSMIVKLYSSLKNALAVFTFLKKIGHSSGCQKVDESTFIDFVNRCPVHSDKFLFGYRWLLLENLRSGKRKGRLSGRENINKAIEPSPFVPKENELGPTAANNIKIYKAENGVTLASFECIETAAADWYESYKLQLNESQALGDNWRQIFETEYLDRDRNIEGIIWRSVSVSQDKSIGVLDSDEAKETSARGSSDGSSDIKSDLIQ